MIKLKKYVLSFSLILALYSCSDSNDVKSVLPKADEPIANESIENQSKVEPENIFSVKTTFSPEFGWGYQILNNDVLFINQPHIPSVQGNKGFDSKNNAIKTAEYIVFKLENDMFPPTITPQELDSLGVI